MRLADVRFAEDGALVYPHTRETASEAALAGYLDEARRLFAERATAEPAEDDPTGLSAEFEELRWFELPAASLA